MGKDGYLLVRSLFPGGKLLGVISALFGVPVVMRPALIPLHRIDPVPI